MSERRPRHYTEEEVRTLRDRARRLMEDLAAVFEAIEEKVTVLSEELVKGDDASALAEVQAQRYDDRSARG